MENHWSEFEYNKLKLLLNYRKVCSMLDVLNSKKAFDEIPPISVELHLTNLCNLKCSWCTDKELRREAASLSLDVVKPLFEYLAEHSVGVTIEGGGEPSTHPQLRDIVRLGHGLGLHMGLISNGVIDLSDIVSLFQWIRISIDASRPEEYLREKGVDRFEQVMRNLGRMAQMRKSSETHLGVGYVITKGNIDGVQDIIRKLDAMHVDYLYLRPVEEAPEITPMLEQMLRLKADILKMQENMRINVMLTINERLVRDNDRLPCIAHSLTCIIHANGDVALCEKRRQDPIILGNINNSDLGTIWSGERRAAVSRRLMDAKNQLGCRVCRITSFNRALFDLNKIHTKRFI